jgi:hypothetical protein
LRGEGQPYLVKPPQILQPVALLMFRVEVIQMFLPIVPIQICQAKLVLCFTGQSSIISTPCHWLMSNLQLSFIFFMRLESFLSCTFLPVSKARTNIICLLRQCKYIKEEKLIPILWTLHRFQWKIGIYFYKNKIKLSYINWRKSK